MNTFPNLRLRRLVVVLAGLLAVTEASAQACGEPWESAADGHTVALAEGLNLMRTCTLSAQDIDALLLRVGESGDTTLRAPLRGLLPSYAPGGYPLTALVLDALWRLGQPEAYFRALVRNTPANYPLGSFAVYLLARRPDEATLTELRALTNQVPNPEDDYRWSVDRYERILRDWHADSLGKPLDVRIYDAAITTYAGALGVTYMEGDSVHFSGINPDGYLDPRTGWAREQLRQFARKYPLETRAAIDSLLRDTAEFSDFINAPEIAPQGTALVRRHLLGVAFPLVEPAPPSTPPAPPVGTAPPAPPPVMEGADVRPILECVAVGEGGALTAYFGYENRYGSAVRVPYGAGNTITPAAYDRRQPQDFPMPNAVAGRPGRTPFYPGYAFTVAFAPAERVVWTLGPRTSTASSTSARCAP